MNVLIAKLGATGDVVRTTPLLRCFSEDQVIWLTASKNTVLLETLRRNLQCFSWEARESIPRLDYDLVINLEDTLEIAKFLQPLRFRQWFGAYADKEDELRYTNDSHCWFDMSLISCYGRPKANRLKLRNRRTYQELIFDGLGLRFQGDKYLLPDPMESDLSGDVAIAAESGPVWPMKHWPYYAELKQQLTREGLIVNVLPPRGSLLQHLADVCKHRCLVGGDSLPMHFALGTETRCVSLFTCTSPWEIYDYGLLQKIVSPRLEEFFYSRERDDRATTAITVQDVLPKVLDVLRSQTQSPR